MHLHIATAPSLRSSSFLLHPACCLSSSSWCSAAVSSRRSLLNRPAIRISVPSLPTSPSYFHFLRLRRIHFAGIFIPFFLLTYDAVCSITSCRVLVKNKLVVLPIFTPPLIGTFFFLAIHSKSGLQFGFECKCAEVVDGDVTLICLF